MRRGVLGGDEVHAAMQAAAYPSDVYPLAREVLAQRYGRGAPWASDREIGLRIGMLTEASALPPGPRPVAVGSGST